MLSSIAHLCYNVCTLRVLHFDQYIVPRSTWADSLLQTHYGGSSKASGSMSNTYNVYTCKSAIHGVDGYLLALFLSSQRICYWIARDL